LIAQQRAINLGKSEKHRRYRKRNQRQLPVDLGGDPDHSQQGEACGYHRDEAVNGEILQGHRIGLDPINGICGAFCIVIGKRQTLNVRE
jgi:hypothetical protein